jgi:transglutaminase-like putative cysteine protease
VYSDERVRRLSLGGVAVGTIADFSYTITDTKPFPPADHYGSWTVSPGAPILRSRLILDVPATVRPNIREENLAFPRQEAVVNGRRIYTWATADVARIRPEMYAADSNGVIQALSYALPRTWADIGTWYAGLAKDRYAMSAATRAKVRELVAGAATREDSLRALHRWVVQDIRYVSVSLGTGGYQPRQVDEVVRTGFGDCKDKATLFVAVLRDWGVRAHPVLLRTGRVDRDLPTVHQFNHAIAALEQPEGGYRFVDLTASRTPWGELPYSVQGEFAIVVRDDGRVDEVTLPLAPPSANVSAMKLTGALTPEGVFNGRYEEYATGVLQYDLRNAFDAPLDSTKRANMTRALANSIYAGMTGDSLQVTVGKDLTVMPRAAIMLTGGKAATRAGETMILSLHIGNMERLAMVADQLEAQAPRRFPIDAEGIFGPSTRQTELRFTLPEGWTARLPASVHATSVFGEFHSEYALEGRDLVVRRRLLGARGVYAPERLPDLTSWLRAMAKEDTRFIVLEQAKGNNAAR